MVCALAIFWYQRPVVNTTESVWEGSVVASDEAPVNVTLAEGTLIELIVLRGVADALEPAGGARRAERR